jgi:hypothetical protein
MARKRNDIEVEDVTGTSQYDGMQVLKDAHSLPGHYIRTRESLTLVQSYFDAFTVTYNSNGKPEEVCYFAGTKPHLTTIGVVGDTNFSLAGTYIIISSGRKASRYAPYFVVDGIGNPPNITGVTNIPVNIQENDDARIVAFALQGAIESINNAFKVTRSNAVLEVTTTKLGITNNTIDGGTGFVISNEAGSREEVEKIKLTYSSDGNPIWQSQELKNYRYNVYTGRFELIETIELTLPSEEVFPVLEFNEINFVAVGATETILTYTVPPSTEFKFRRSNVSGCNMGTYVIKVDGVVIDKLATYYTKYNDVFNLDDIIFTEGKVITIEVQNRGTQAGNFNANIQGRLSNV